MPILARTSELRKHRVVWTYQPERWPVGCITASESGDGGLMLEHVVAFQPGVLSALVREGIATARAEGYHYLIAEIPDDFPPGPALERVLWRAGFVRFARLGPRRQFVRWLR